MPASLRELRQRRSSVSTIKKVTRAMELIAASRIIKAQQRAQAAEQARRDQERREEVWLRQQQVNPPRPQPLGIPIRRVS